MLLSSHLLSEVQQVCDDVTIIAEGRLVATGRVQDVLAVGSTGDLRLRAPDPQTAYDILRADGHQLTADGDAWRVHGVTDPSTITRILAESGCYLSELSPIAADLESVFLDLTRTDA